MKDAFLKMCPMADFLKIGSKNLEQKAYKFVHFYRLYFVQII